MIPLLVFASVHGFSFENASINTELGSSGMGLFASNQSESHLVKIQTFTVYLICALLATQGLRAVLRGFRQNLLLLALVAEAIVSAFWSQNSRVTINASVFLTLNVALAFYLVWRFSSNDLMKLMMFVGSIAAAGSLILIIFFPQYGTQLRGSYAHGAWQGIFGHKNTCAEVLACLAIPACFVKLSGRFSRVFRICYFLTLFGIIAMTQSAGGWGICFCTMCSALLLLHLRRAGGKDVVAIALIFAAALVCLACLAFVKLEPLLALFGKDMTLTGRTVLWHHLFGSLLKRPFTGFGYMAFWMGLQSEASNVAIVMKWPGLGYAENGILELWLGLGAIGVFFFLALFTRAIRDGIYCFRRDASPATMFYLCILLFTLFANIEAGKLVYPSHLECILQYTAFIGLHHERQAVREQPVYEQIAA
jgi:O-antigen ligase